MTPEQAQKLVEDVDRNGRRGPRFRLAEEAAATPEKAAAPRSLFLREAPELRHAP